jgi:hypothetical protein
MRKIIIVLLLLCAKIAQAQIYIDSYRFAGAAPGIVTDNLIGHYDVGDPTSYPGTGTTVFDLTSPQENISLFGATYNAGGYMNFDGVNDYGSLSGAAFNSFTTYTIEIICSIDGSADNFDGFIMKNTTNSWNDGIGVFYESNQLKHFINNYSGPVSGYTIGTTEPLSQLIFTYDGTAIRTYQNGVQVASTSTTASINNSSSAFLLFARLGAAGSITGFLGGKIYALRIYNDALSASEVLQNYNATKTRYGY